MTEPPAAPAEVKLTRASFRRYLATSDKPLPTLVRRLNRGVRSLSLPAPRIIVKPMLWCFLALRSVVYFVRRVFICEPLFKAYCKRHGKNLRTDIFIHWIQGKGDIIIGDDVLVDGKCSFAFARRFVDRPTIQIGDRTRIGHGCTFIIGKRIQIGRNCMIAGGCRIFDSSGHPADVADRRAGKPPTADDVQEVVIGDDVWIGVNTMIFPGVTIGEGSVISACSVIRSSIPSYSVVAGSAARVVATLPKPPAPVSN